MCGFERSHGWTDGPGKPGTRPNTQRRVLNRFAIYIVNNIDKIDIMNNINEIIFDRL